MRRTQGFEGGTNRERTQVKTETSVLRLSGIPESALEGSKRGKPAPGSGGYSPGSRALSRATAQPVPARPQAHAGLGSDSRAPTRPAPHPTGPSSNGFWTRRLSPAPSFPAHESRSAAPFGEGSSAPEPTGATAGRARRGGGGIPHFQPAPSELNAELRPADPRPPPTPRPRPRPAAPAAPLLPPAPSLPRPPRSAARLSRAAEFGAASIRAEPAAPPNSRACRRRRAFRTPSPSRPPAPGARVPSLLFPPPFHPLRALSPRSQSPGRQEGGGGTTMSFEGGHGGSRCRGAESRDAEPPPQPPQPPPPPGEPAPVPAAPRYLPPLPAPPATPERAAGPSEPPGEVAQRRRGADELPPPPLPLQPAGQEVAAAGDSGEGPRRLPEVAAAKGGPGESEASAGGEGERRGAGDQPETRSVCSSRSSSSGGGDQRSGHQHQHHQPICKICFQGAEQVRPGGGSSSQRSSFQHHGQRTPPSQLPPDRLLWFCPVSASSSVRSPFHSCEGK